MDIKLRVCSCQKDNLNLWKDFSQAIENLLNARIKLSLFEKFPQDLEEKVDLFYASFSLSLHLIEKKYKPIAKFKNQSDYYLALSPHSIEKLRKKDYIKVVITDRFIFFYLLFYIISSKLRIDFSKIQPILKSSYEDVEKEILNNFGDLYILPEKRAEPYLDKFTFVEKIPFKVNHYFLVPSESPFLKDIKKALFSVDKSLINLFGFEEIEEISLWEEEFLKNCSFISRNFPQLIEHCTILDTFLNAPFFGIAIYHEKFLYVNPYFCKILGYTPEEFKNLAVWELLYYEEDKKKVKDVAERRLRGEYFFTPYLPATLKTKDGRKVEALIFAGTIFYQSKYCGFVIGVDITESQRLQKFLNLLRHVNQVLVTCNYEEEIYERILPVIHQSLNLKGVWISDEKGNILYSYPEAFKPEEELKFTSEQKEIFFLNLPPHYLCIIPLIREGRVVAFLNLLSEDENIFSEETKDLLKELQEDLNLALKKIVLSERDLILRKFSEEVNELLIIADKKGNIEYINPAGKNLLGIEDSKIRETNSFKLFSIPQEILKREEDTTRFSIYVREDQKRVLLEIKISFIKLPKGTKIVIVGRDLTKELEFEKEREILRYQDPLTGLLNRRGFVKRTSDLLSVLNVPSALFMIDFYNFSYINHFYGFEVGDFCLKEITRRLQEVIGDRGFIGRTGGDEFSLFIINIAEEGLSDWIRRLEPLLKAPIVYEDKKIPLGWNIGVVVFPQDGENMEVLWKKLNLVIVEAKRRGPNTIEIYNPEIEKEVEKSFKAEILIKRAIAEDLFVFYYQPYFETETLKVAGVEALARIKDNSNLILPSEFISTLEASPYLMDFGMICFKKNIEKIKKWKIPVSINISSQSFKTLDFLNILNNFKEILSQYPYFLELEITEHTLAENIERAKKIIETLKTFKVKICLDDFGTGYSSLNYLKDLPIDIIKIDISFIRDMVKEEKTYYIVANIINLSHFLGMKVIAEGVETEKQLEILKRLKCDYVQGFLLSKPLPEEEIEKILKANQ
jgi:diguanylate cyclase (GGDEF)-like protein/PAS domain S-box-containing protein